MNTTNRITSKNSIIQLSDEKRDMIVEYIILLPIYRIYISFLLFYLFYIVIYFFFNLVHFHLSNFVNSHLII